MEAKAPGKWYFLPHACTHIACQRVMLLQRKPARDTPACTCLPTCLLLSAKLFNGAVAQPGSGKKATPSQSVLPCLGHNLLCCCLKLAAIFWSHLVLVQCSLKLAAIFWSHLVLVQCNRTITQSTQPDIKGHSKPAAGWTPSAT